MKTKNNLLLAGLFPVALLLSTATHAQQQQRVLPFNPAQQQKAAGYAAASYSYKLYSAPNNMVG